MAESKLQVVMTLRDEATAKLDGIKGRLGGMGEAFKKVGIVAAVGGAAVAGGLALAARNAAEEEQGIQKLRQALQNVGVDYDKNAASIEGVVSAQQKKTTFGDGPQREALSALLAITGSYDEAMKRLPIAMDMAAGSGMDLTAAATLLGRVSEENTTVLKRYGIEVKEGATATDLLGAVTQKFGGQAEAAAKTSSGQFAQIQNMLGDIVEDVGAAVLPALKEVMAVFKTILAEIDLKPLIAAIGELAKQVLPILVAILKPVSKLFIDLAPIILQMGEKIFPVLLRALEKILTPLMPIVERLLPPFAELLVAILDAILPLIELGLDVLILALIKTLEVLTPLIELGLKILIPVVKGVGAAIQEGVKALKAFGEALTVESMVRLWEGIKGAFRGGINFLIGLAERWVNIYVWAVNQIIGLINKVLSVEIMGRRIGITLPTIPEIVLPRLEAARLQTEAEAFGLAEGGIVRRPTLALIGERGPEAVVPLGKGAGVTIIFNAPVYGMDSFRRAVTQAVRDAALGGAFRGVPIGGVS